MYLSERTVLLQADAIWGQERALDISEGEYHNLVDGRAKVLPGIHRRNHRFYTSPADHLSQVRSARLGSVGRHTTLSDNVMFMQ